MPLEGWEKVNRDDPYYKACMTVTAAAGAIVGGATGSILGPAGTVGGYAGGVAWGFAAGYLACPYLVPAVRKKIEDGLALNDQEVAAAADAMGRYANVAHAVDAVKLVAVVRRVGGASRQPRLAALPDAAAKRLLEHLA